MDNSKITTFFFKNSYFFFIVFFIAIFITIFVVIPVGHEPSSELKYTKIIINDCKDTVQNFLQECIDHEADKCVFMKVDGKEISGEDFCKFVEEKGK